MKNTVFFKELSEGKDIRECINSQLQEDRFYGYAQLISTNPEVAKVAKGGCSETTFNWLKAHIKDVGIPVNLTDMALRKVAMQLVLMFRQEG